MLTRGGEREQAQLPQMDRQSFERGLDPDIGGEWIDQLEFAEKIPGAVALGDSVVWGCRHIRRSTTGPVGAPPAAFFLTCLFRPSLRQPSRLCNKSVSGSDDGSRNTAKLIASERGRVSAERISAHLGPHANFSRGSNTDNNTSSMVTGSSTSEDKISRFLVSATMAFPSFPA